MASKRNKIKPGMRETYDVFMDWSKRFNRKFKKYHASVSPHTEICNVVYSHNGLTAGSSFSLLELASFVGGYRSFLRHHVCRVRRMRKEWS